MNKIIIDVKKLFRSFCFSVRAVALWLTTSVLKYTSYETLASIIRDRSGTCMIYLTPELSYTKDHLTSIFIQVYLV